MTRYTLYLLVFAAATFWMAVAQDGTVLKPVSISGETQTFEIPSWGHDAPALLMDVPVGFALTRRQGPDFDVYFLEQPGDPAHRRMGIYVGHTPNPMASKSATVEPGMVGPRKIGWHVWSEEDQGKTLYFREAIVPAFFKGLAKGTPDSRKPAATDSGPQGPLYGNLSIHVWAQGTDADQVKTMAGWAKSIRKSGR